MQQEKKEKVQGLNKIEAGEQFNQLFADQDNTNCFQCGKKSKQWAETKHAIFLCLNCAANFKSITRVVNVKSIGLDLWKQDQLMTLRAGGNRRFKQYLNSYGMAETQTKTIFRSKAAEYYRRLLQSQIKGKQIGPRPSLQQGKMPCVAQIPLSQMTSDQMVTQAKQRISWAGQRTKYYGTMAYEKVHHKITSGQLKQDAKNAAKTVSTTAKNLWGFISSKIDQIKKPKAPGSNQARQM